MLYDYFIHDETLEPYRYTEQGLAHIGKQGIWIKTIQPSPERIQMATYEEFLDAIRAKVPNHDPEEVLARPAVTLDEFLRLTNRPKIS